MLNIMEIENEIEYFRAWLKDYVKEKKIITGKALAKSLGTSAQRISQLHSGRIDNGIRTFPTISFDERHKIAKVVGIKYEKIIERGKYLTINIKTKSLAEDDIRRIIREEQDISNNTTDITTKRHRQLIEKFQQKDLALEINAELLNLEGIDRKKLQSVLDFIKYQKKIAEEEISKKRTANGED